jgi:hypothetical protein
MLIVTVLVALLMSVFTLLPQRHQIPSRPDHGGPLEHAHGCASAQAVLHRRRPRIMERGHYKQQLLGQSQPSHKYRRLLRVLAMFHMLSNHCQRLQVVYALALEWQSSAQTHSCCDTRALRKYLDAGGDLIAAHMRTLAKDYRRLYRVLASVVFVTLLVRHACRGYYR